MTVKIEWIPPHKIILTIKAVRVATGLNLRESKQLVDGRPECNIEPRSENLSDFIKELTEIGVRFTTQSCVILIVPLDSNCPDRTGAARHMQTLLQEQGYDSTYEIR